MSALDYRKGVRDGYKAAAQSIAKIAVKTKDDDEAAILDAVSLGLLDAALQLRIPGEHDDEEDE